MKLVESAYDDWKKSGRQLSIDEIKSLSINERREYCAWIKSQNEKFEQEADNLDKSAEKYKSSVTQAVAKQNIAMMGLVAASFAVPYINGARKALRKIKGLSTEEIERKLDEMQQQLDDLAIDIRDGKISVKQASAKSNTIYMEMRIISRKLRKMRKKETE